MKGGRTRTTWNKGEKPPVQKPKGTKNRRTILKEVVGKSNWDGLRDFIIGYGATIAVQELANLTGKDYLNAYYSLAEFFKAKSTRVHHVDLPAPRDPITRMTPEEIRYISKCLEEEI